MMAATDKQVLSPTSMSLNGKSVLITRRREQAADMVREIERLGGRAVTIPLIDVADPETWAPVDSAITRIASFEAVVFASANAAERFLARCAAKGVQANAMGHLRVYTVGSKTRDVLERAGLRVSVVPDALSSSALSDVFGEERVRGKNFLIPCGDRSGDELGDALSAMGGRVERIIVYRTVRPSALEREKLRDHVLHGMVDVLTFASPSAVAHFAEIFTPDERGGIRNRCVIGVIGPTTGQAAREAGLDASVVAGESTGIGLIRAISEYCS